MKLSILLSVEVFVSFFFSPLRILSVRGRVLQIPPVEALKLAGVWMFCSKFLQNNERIPEILRWIPKMAGNRYSRTLPEKMSKHSEVKFDGNSKN